jgi:PIN domain nuclease of toxin-antitoxin system
MRLLLDTQVFIWWDSVPEKLPPHLLEFCQDPVNILVLSVASVWEMQIKAQLGKLDLNTPLADIIASQQQTNQMEVLPVQLAHVLALQYLPPHHKDPFDRLIIAQANAENIAVMSVDTIFPLYLVTLIS